MVSLIHIKTLAILLVKQSFPYDIVTLETDTTLRNPTGYIIKPLEITTSSKYPSNHYLIDCPEPTPLYHFANDAYGPDATSLYSRINARV